MNDSTHPASATEQATTVYCPLCKANVSMACKFYDCAQKSRHEKAAEEEEAFLNRARSLQGA